MLDLMISRPLDAVGSRLLRELEVARLASVHRATLRRWVARGKFPAPVRLPGRRVAWHHCEVLAWIAALPPAR